MWELWMNLNYGHLYIPLTSNKANSSQKPTFFSWKKTTVVWVKIYGKKNLLQANGKKLILPLEKYFKIFKDMIIGTVGT